MDHLRMKSYRFARRLGFMLLILVVTGMLFFRSAGAQVQAEARAEILLNFDGENMPVPVDLVFDANGGPIEGSLYLEWDLDSNGSADLIYDLSFAGTFSGFPDGRLEGTIEGSFLPKGFIDIMTKLAYDMCVASDCANPQDFPERVSDYQPFVQPVLGTWEGVISEDAVGSGTWTILYLPSPDGQSRQEGEQSNTWDLVALTISTVPDQAATPGAGPTPDPVLSQDEPQLLVPDEGAAQQGELPAAQIGWMAGAALVGGAAGAGVSQVLMRRRLPPLPAPMAPSPATGRMVPEAQARQEQARMDSGWVYRAGEGWVAPHGNTFDPSRPSILAREAEQARAQMRADFERYQAERKARLKQERISEFSDMAERHMRTTQESLDRMLTSIDIAEAGIETTYDVAAAVLVRRFPVKTLGRAGALARYFGRKFMTEAVDEGYSQVKILADNANKLAAGEETSLVQDELDNLSSKWMDYVPGPKISNPAFLIIKDATKSLAKNAWQGLISRLCYTGH
jgi:hypothetical protein